MMTERDFHTDARLRGRAARLTLTTCLLLTAPAWAGEETDTLPDELEVTLEVFDDSAALEGFEVRLMGLEDTDGDRETDDLAERMARFEEEVHAAADLDERDDQEPRDEERDPSEAREERVVADHDGNRLEELADFDEADDMDELDLAEPEEDGDASDESLDDGIEDGVLEEDALDDGELADDATDDGVEDVMEEETDELVEEQPPAGSEDDVVS